MTMIIFIIARNELIIAKTADRNLPLIGGNCEAPWDVKAKIRIALVKMEIFVITKAKIQCLRIPLLSHWAR